MSKNSDVWRELGNDLEKVVGDSFESGVRSGIEDALRSGGAGNRLAGSLGSAVSDAISSVLFGAPAAAGGAGGVRVDGAPGTAGVGAGLFSGARGGGLAQKVLGSPLSFFGGGLGGVLGGAGALYSLYKGFTGGGRSAPMSGVDPIFDTGATYTGGGMDTLLGSDIFSRASFSSRNIDNDLFRKFASARTGGEVVVHVKPSREFDAISEDKWVKTSKLNELTGIARRTKFNKG